MPTTNFAALFLAGIILAFASGPAMAGDAVKGKRIAKKCTTCHTLHQGGKSRLGPNLFGVLGRRAAAVKGYRYSKAMAASGVIWDEGAFIEFLAKPKSYIKGTKMSFAGIRNAGQRADLMAYFKSLAEKPTIVQSGGNAANGKIAAISKCKVCHSFEKDGKTVFGPNLFGMAGQPAGSVQGYKYSKALLASKLTWTDANLIEFLANPEQFIKGTKARFPGVKKASTRADIIAFLKTLK